MVVRRSVQQYNNNNPNDNADARATLSLSLLSLPFLRAVFIEITTIPPPCTVNTFHFPSISQQSANIYWPATFHFYLIDHISSMGFPCDPARATIDSFNSIQYLVVLFQVSKTSMRIPKISADNSYEPPTNDPDDASPPPPPSEHSGVVTNRMIN